MDYGGALPFRLRSFFMHTSEEDLLREPSEEALPQREDSESWERLDSFTFKWRSFLSHVGCAGVAARGGCDPGLRPSTLRRTAGAAKRSAPKPAGCAPRRQRVVRRPAQHPPMPPASPDAGPAS